jgi:hypothetical protein
VSTVHFRRSTSKARAPESGTASSAFGYGCGRVLLRYLLTIAVLAAIFASPAAAKPVELMPGVTYDRKVEFTAHGPKVIHVLTAPKPGGLYALKPVLSNGTLLGRERVTAMQRRAEQSSTTAGVNGDLFTWVDGIPSSGLIQDGVLKTTPHPKRSMVGVMLFSGALLLRPPLWLCGAFVGLLIVASRVPAAGGEPDRRVEPALRHQRRLSTCPARTPTLYCRRCAPEPVCS